MVRADKQKPRNQRATDIDSAVTAISSIYMYRRNLKSAPIACAEPLNINNQANHRDEYTFSVVLYIHKLR